MSFANRLFLSLYCSAPIIKQSDLYIFLYIKIFLLLRVLDLLFSYSVFKVHGTYRPFSILLNTENLTHLPLSKLFIAQVVGSSGFEPPTSRLSGARSNQLSYEPMVFPL